MEKQPIIDTEKYLDKMDALDISISAEELMASNKRLSTPFEHIEYKDNNTIEISVNGSMVYIQTAPYEYEKDGNVYLDNSLREVKTLVFGTNGTYMNMMGVLPTGTRIVLYGNSDENTGTITQEDEHGFRNINLLGKLDSPKMVAVLLHEIGHAVDFERLKQMGLEKLTDDHRDSDIAEEIRRERAAHAFMFREMKPLLNGAQGRKDLINVAKYGALGGYYIKARMETKKRNGKEEAMKEHFFQNALHYYDLE